MSIDLATLNVTLSASSYLEGCYPSKKDAETFEKINLADLKHHAHVRRWYNHIASFCPCQRASWKSKDEKEKKDDDFELFDDDKKKEAKKDEDDFDLFGDEDSEEEARREADFDRRAKEAQARIDAKNKAKGKVDIAKSMCIMEVKPYDDETDLQELAAKVRAIQKDGLTWGEHKLVEIAFGAKKLQIGFVIEDEKVPSTEEIQEQIEEFDEVQSADTVSINKM